MVCRRAMLAEASEVTPTALPYLIAAYGAPTVLFFAGLLIMSRNGLHQGDPLAGLGFMLVLNRLLKEPLLQQLISKLDLRAFYFDDGHVGGDVMDVYRFFRAFNDAGAKYGIVVNIAKCGLYRRFPDMRDHEFPPEVRVRHFNELVVLGAPCGDRASANKFIMDRLPKWKQLLNSVVSMQNKHAAINILVQCIAGARTQYLARALGSLPAWEAVDAAVTAAGIELLMLQTATPATIRQMTLAARSGGIGIRMTAPFADMANIVAIQRSLEGCYDPTSTILGPDAVKLLTVSARPLATRLGDAAPQGAAARFC
jgi:hypothetical protein